MPILLDIGLWDFEGSEPEESLFIDIDMEKSLGVKAMGPLRREFHEEWVVGGIVAVEFVEEGIVGSVLMVEGPDVVLMRCREL